MAINDLESDCPLGDASRWLKDRAERLGVHYNGPAPELFSPANREEEERNLYQVLFGRRIPRTAFERHFLRFMGGVREDPPPKKRVACSKCSREFEASGYPGPRGAEIRYPAMCQSCADKKYVNAKVPKREARPVHNDP
jgi:hypothetical protein